ncbi:nucleoside phosphatase family-domain-containing protein [Rhodofomes roseus]|uniref:Nucleoside phosphatase family-domain-containing protein n=1 Tax=Rhodofomes roseus TaxID=34475 RepID=A0ABQ8KWT3_9APHY|nr:nucleoside phosphatase family-domain-containing protein [Rhodofomes roseus]KAH9843133.1 nucleoside phosphatase family-domain-containing protein [Rhodofomes roseus]
MPPPTSQDAWLAARRFGVVIDAGSSGSRLQIYSWKDPRVQDGGRAQTSLPAVEKGTQNGEDWSVKVQPGISSFGDNPAGVAGYLEPLLEHARSHVPPSLQPSTPLFLLATAGMRLLTPQQQAEVLRATCTYLKTHSNFRLDDPSPLGPCGSSVRIISGEEEGLFGWIAVNYLTDGFSGAGEQPLTYGFLDMGGASTQIAFEPSTVESDKSSDNLIDVRLRLLNGREVQHKVFVTTWLGYGTNQARERYVSAVVNDYLYHYPSASPSQLIPDPCLPKDLRLTESTSSSATYTLVGMGSFDRCLSRTLPLLNKSAPCPDAHCLFNGVPTPHIDFAAAHFIGISEYWYSSEHVFGLGGAYDVVQYERAAEQFCGRDWGDIVRKHERDKTRWGEGRQTMGMWGPEVEIPRLQLQCFKAAWLVNVLHEGLGMPRIVDPGGNSTSGHNGAQEVEKEAARKGLGSKRPAFQSLDTVGDIAISWTLGKMVLEASKEVPLAGKGDRPIVDPMEDLPEDSHLRPKPPFWRFDAIEDRLSDHLPPSLSKETLGFSLVAFLFYIAVLTLLFGMLYRMRHRIRSTYRRYTRTKERMFTQDGYAMEGGFASHPRSPSPWTPSPTRLSFQQAIRPIAQKLSSTLGISTRPSSVRVKLTGPPSNHNRYSPTRSSPIRSNSSPFPFSQTKPQPGLGLGMGGGLAPPPPGDANGSASSFAPTPGSPRLDGFAVSVSNGSLSSLTSRSRNSSQMNLSSVAGRGGNGMARTASGGYGQMARTMSGSHGPVGSLYLDE